MSFVFIDTSAFYALLVAGDRNHHAATHGLERLERDGANLVTSSFVLQETIALLQARLGMGAVIRFAEQVLPGLDIEWIDSSDFSRGLTALLVSGNRAVSLTDHTSFQVMRRRGLTRAFAFDEDFAREGFELV